MRPRLLDLFCGAGGCAVGYHRAGFDVIGVDINPQPNYPFEFIQHDAMTFPLDGFDAIHASPPCQAFSTIKAMPNAGEHADLLTPIRERLERHGKPWIIENVIGAPIRIGHAPLFTEACGIMLCGSMFDLNNGTHELRRHRLFEASFTMPQLKCRHRLDVIGFYGDHARSRQRTVNGNRERGGDITGNKRKMPLVRDLMGIDWMTWREATQAIPPVYTKWIGTQLINILERN